MIVLISNENKIQKDQKRKFISTLNFGKTRRTVSSRSDNIKDDIERIPARR